ncbi:MAG: 3-oxoadipate enol-lactonase [Hyphomicrobiales bacterium]|jgi:pimeloyl-ACP methyl ester carboxylesterase|nr:3-oxoadipate enol-lactonase [Hyphomicrobiales bacterium]
MIPVVFLHGIGGGARSFAPQIASFAGAGYHPVALDLMGYGTREPVEAMSFEALAEDVEFAISESGLERPVLVGHSMGGMVVQTMLRRRPDDYAAAVLSCTSPAFGNPAGDFQKKFVADRLAPLDAGRTMADVAPGAADNVMAPNPDPAGRALFIEQYAAVPEATYRAAVKCLVTFDERANLPNISIPILCLAAELDRNAPPPVLEKMAGKIPGAYYLCLSGLGHMPNLEAPAAFDRAIFNFLTHALGEKS